MLVSLFKQIQESARNTIENVSGRPYATVNVNGVKDPEPDTLEVSTLTALVDYLKTNVDAIHIDKTICHVVSPTKVNLLSALHGGFQQRSGYLEANARVRRLDFNKFQDGEAFNIWLQSCFVEDPVFVDGQLRATDKGLILQYVGNVKTDAVQTVGDDGVTQEITVKTGIASVGNVRLPNPVTLRPYRTFNEIQQPASQFVFRARSGPEFALIEADNGAWENEAVLSIKAYMEKQVPGLHVIA